MDLDRAHQIARDRGPIPIVYWIVRAILQPFFRVYFRLSRVGREHVPLEGPVLFAANHRSFSDPFMIGLCLRRPLHFVAKVELFDKRWKAWLLLALGAFPIRRGESDEEAMETARLILEQGGVVGIFPEGTRVRPGPLGEPKRGVGRLALETGAPIVPAAITGTSHLWRAALPKLKRVQLAFLPAVPPQRSKGRDEVSELIDDRVWPAVREEYGRLRANPGLIAAGFAALGLGSGLVAKRRLEASRKPRLLGKIEPRKLRRQQTRGRLLKRVRSLR
jgi:1-acyl-sn-glycerol-3-phosphate acyltransferase